MNERLVFDGVLKASLGIYIFNSNNGFLRKYVSFHKISIFSNRSPVGFHKRQLSRWYLIQQILIIVVILFYCYLLFLGPIYTMALSFDSISQKKGCQIQLQNQNKKRATNNITKASKRKISERAMDRQNILWGPYKKDSALSPYAKSKCYDVYFYSLQPQLPGKQRKIAKFYKKESKKSLHILISSTVFKQIS